MANEVKIKSNIGLFLKHILKINYASLTKDF